MTIELLYKISAITFMVSIMCVFLAPIFDLLNLFKSKDVLFNAVMVFMSLSFIISLLAMICQIAMA